MIDSVSFSLLQILFQTMPRNYQGIWIFDITEKKNTSIDQFIMPNAVNMLKVRFKFKKIWDSELSSLNQQVYDRDATRWHTFLCKHLHIFLGLLQILIQLRSFTKFGMINRSPRILCLNKKNKLRKAWHGAFHHSNIDRVSWTFQNLFSLRARLSQLDLKGTAEGNLG